MLVDLKNILCITLFMTIRTNEKTYISNPIKTYNIYWFLLVFIYKRTFKKYERMKYITKEKFASNIVELTRTFQAAPMSASQFYNKLLSELANIEESSMDLSMTRITKERIMTEELKTKTFLLSQLLSLTQLSKNLSEHVQDKWIGEAKEHFLDPSTQYKSTLPIKSLNID